MIWNVFIFFDPFLVSEIEIENFSFFVTNYAGSIENLTDLKILIKYCNFSLIFGTKEAQRIKCVQNFQAQ